MVWLVGVYFVVFVGFVGLFVFFFFFSLDKGKETETDRQRKRSRPTVRQSLFHSGKDTAT